MESVRQALEASLVANPDDLAAHAAYADHLTEAGDPRGEFITVQLALEDPARSPDERRNLQRREAELLAAHAREWLGDVGRFLVGDWSGPDKPFEYRLARGWLDHLRVLPFPDALFSALGRSPEARLLRTLEVVYDMRLHPFDFDEHLVGPNKALRKGEQPSETYEACEVMPGLIASPYLTNLRSFKVGFSDDDPPRHSTMVGPFQSTTGRQVIDLLAQCSRLEELYLNTELAHIDELFAYPELGRLRVLQYYFGTNYYAMMTGGPEGISYPLGMLADNPSLTRLTTLRLHPGRDATVDLDEFGALVESRHLPALKHLQVHMTTFGDEGARRVVESGILRRLQTLDLGYGTMTDAGARVLAGSPDLKRLTVLDVSRNALTPAGVRALAATGVRVVAGDQHDPDDTDFLYEVDAE